MTSVMTLESGCERVDVPWLSTALKFGSSPVAQPAPDWKRRDCSERNERRIVSRLQVASTLTGRAEW